MPAVPALDAATRRSLALLLAGALIPLAGCTSGDDGPTSEGGGSGASRDVPHLDREAGRLGRHDALGGRLAAAHSQRLPARRPTPPPSASPAPRCPPSSRSTPRPGRSSTRTTCEAADVTESEPRQTVVYKLNPKAEWSSGRAIGAADFKAQWKALSGKQQVLLGGAQRRVRPDQEGDQGREQARGEGRLPQAVRRLEVAVHAALPEVRDMARPGDFNKSARTSLPDSAGPFRVEKIHKGDTSVTLVRDKRWWGEPAKLKRIVLRVVPRDQRQDALADGKLDMAEIDVSTLRRIVRAHKGEGGEGDAKSKTRERAHGGTTKKEARERAREDRNLRDIAVRHAFEPAYTQLALNGAGGPARRRARTPRRRPRHRPRGHRQARAARHRAARQAARQPSADDRPGRLRGQQRRPRRRRTWSRRSRCWPRPAGRTATSHVRGPSKGEDAEKKGQNDRQGGTPGSNADGDQRAAQQFAQPGRSRSRLSPPSPPPRPPGSPVSP